MKCCRRGQLFWFVNGLNILLLWWICIWSCLCQSGRFGWTKTELSIAIQYRGHVMTSCNLGFLYETRSNQVVHQGWVLSKITVVSQSQLVYQMTGRCTTWNSWGVARGLARNSGKKGIPKPVGRKMKQMTWQSKYQHTETQCSKTWTCP